MNWWKASTASAIAQAVRMLSGLIIIKIIAVVLGPEGFGRLGHFMSMITILTVLAGGGVLNGIVKYVAEYKDNPEKLFPFLSNALAYSLVFSSLIFFVFLLLAKKISLFLFDNDNDAWLFVFLGFIQFSYALVTFCNGTINGLRETGKFAKIIVVGTLIGLPVSCYAVYRFGFAGAVIGLSLMNACLLFPGLFGFYRLGFLKKIKFAFNFGDFRSISKFSLMQIISLATLPLAEIYIRSLIIHDAGWEQAGLWQSLMRLSSVYIGFFTTFLSAYYMPTLSGIIDKDEVIRYVSKYLTIIGCAFFVIASSVYICRSLVFSIVFSKDFVIPSNYVKFQLIGDFFKILSYVIGFLIVAKAKTKLYILSEFIQTFFYLGVATLLMKFGNVYQVFPAYALSNFLYFLICFSGFLIYGKTWNRWLDKFLRP
ncbi:O-antigen translocase [Collimonas sp.]|uniref:O-antigen translocase n=1 Tax=Collimonas sp. TaxID=1963772 RepID=UPI002C4E7047|nr:O-antigen translocase [Collimonas sp.]HWX00138.1 O-antigen translocase [Collimonas sp.]